MKNLLDFENEVAEHIQLEDEVTRCSNGTMIKSHVQFFSLIKKWWSYFIKQLDLTCLLVLEQNYGSTFLVHFMVGSDAQFMASTIFQAKTLDGSFEFYGQNRVQ